MATNNRVSKADQKALRGERAGGIGGTAKGPREERKAWREEPPERIRDTGTKRRSENERARSGIAEGLGLIEGHGNFSLAGTGGTTGPPLGRHHRQL